MQQVSQALDEVKNLYAQLVGKPAPAIAPNSYVPFPPGVDPLDYAVQEVAELKRLSESMSQAGRAVAWVPPADTFATPERYVFRVEVPGVDRDELKVFVRRGECIVRGRRKAEDDPKGIGPISLERPWGTFERRFVLPADCLADRLSARYSKGVLEVAVDRESEGPPREAKVELV
jgi:HSP20 family protein